MPKKIQKKVLKSRKTAKKTAKKAVKVRRIGKKAEKVRKTAVKKSKKKAVVAPKKRGIAAKKAARKPAAKKAPAKIIAAAEKPIGAVTHYYDHIGVAVLRLSAPLILGDKIRISGHGKEFEQGVVSMQVNHQSVAKAGKGQEVGLKTDKEAKEGDLVFRA
ncbi:MAG: hypothetical protein HZA37_02575 [Parcubacteria group bacterium]|nr:hypothetical protein [Parcubacteria group bacterium]